MEESVILGEVEKAKRGTREVRITFAPEAGVPEKRYLEDLIFNELVRLPPDEIERLREEYETNNWGPNRTYHLILTDRFFQYGLDFFPGPVHHFIQGFKYIG